MVDEKVTGNVKREMIRQTGDALFAMDLSLLIDSAL